MDITICEISPDVVQAAKEHFQIDDYPFRLIEGDALKFIEETEETFDWIISDAFWVDVVPISRLNNVDVFRLMRSRLNEDGNLIVNIVRKPKPVEMALYDAFDGHQYSVYSGDKDDTHILVGLNSDRPRNFSITAMRNMASGFTSMNLPCGTDWNNLVDCILRHSPHTNVRLVL